MLDWYDIPEEIFETLKEGEMAHAPVYSQWSFKVEFSLTFVSMDCCVLVFPILQEYTSPKTHQLTNNLLPLEYGSFPYQP